MADKGTISSRINSSTKNHNAINYSNTIISSFLEEARSLV